MNRNNKHLKLKLKWEITISRKSSYEIEESIKLIPSLSSSRNFFLLFNFP